MSRHSVEIIPDDPTDEAYLEEVLGLRAAGDSVPLVRVNASGLTCIAYAQAKRTEVVREPAGAVDNPGPTG